MSTKTDPYIVENIDISRTGNKCDCKPFGAKSSSSAYLYKISPKALSTHIPLDFGDKKTN